MNELSRRTSVRVALLTHPQLALPAKNWSSIRERCSLRLLVFSPNNIPFKAACHLPESHREGMLPSSAARNIIWTFQNNEILKTVEMMHLEAAKPFTKLQIQKYTKRANRVTLMNSPESNDLWYSIALQFQANEVTSSVSHSLSTCYYGPPH